MCFLALLNAIVFAFALRLCVKVVGANADQTVTGLSEVKIDCFPAL